MLKRLTLFLIFVLVFMLLTKLIYADKVINRIIAVVNGEIITSYDLDKEVKNFRFYSEQSSQTYKQIDPRFLLQKLIDEILLKEEANRLKINVSDEEVNKRIELIKQRQNLSDEEFKKLLEKNNMTLDELRDKIRTSIKISRLLNLMVYDKIIITSDEIKQYYESHKELYNTSKKVRLKIIVTDDKNKLMDLRDKIERGLISFEDAAKKCSIGPGSEEGGDLGMLKWDDLRPEFKKNLKGLKEKEISNVFSVDGQYVILKRA